MVAVITYNLEYGAERYGVEEAAKLIRQTGASVALLQEAPRDIARQIARILGWYHVEFPKSETAILSDRPVTRVDEGSHYGIAKIGNTNFCVIHLSDHPYIPFEATGINYPPECNTQNSCFHSSNPRVLEDRSLQARKSELREIASALQSLKKTDKIIVGGDFNEPSHRDWGEEEVGCGRVPLAIGFPCTRVIEELGFTDTYRHLHPSTCDHPGYTWPDRKVEYDSRPDRIDFIFARGVRRLLESEVISTGGLSDHAIVRTQYSV